MTNQDPLALSARPIPSASDMGYVGGRGGGRAAASRGPAGRRRPERCGPSRRTNIGPQGLPLIKPPWGRITAIDLNSGDHVWMIANGDAPDYIVESSGHEGNRPDERRQALARPADGHQDAAVRADGNNLWASPAGAGGNLFRAIDKKTGKVLHEMALPAMATGIPMTYMVNDRQFIVVAIGAAGVPASLVALALP